MKRGFSSLIGLAALIEKYSKKVIDVTIKSSVCKACEKWSGKYDTIEFAACYEGHEEECQADHKGSVGLVEVSGIIEMFERSINLCNIWYQYYIRDGDTKTYKHLFDEQPYGKNLIENK